MTWSHSVTFTTCRIQSCWLSARGSLTKRLMALGPFKLEILSEEIGFPKLEETLGDERMPFQIYWTREIIMHIHGVPCVFARSLIPPEDDGVWSAARRIGGSPLGSILYNKAVQRTAFAFTAYQAADFMHAPMFDIGKDERILARRSKFLKCGIPILVSESFLPQFWNVAEHERLALECIG